MWRAVLNEVMNVRFHKTWDISALEKERLAAQEEPCWIDLVLINLSGI